MRLLEARIDGFGKYQDARFEFDAGLNVLLGRNEAGKSTLQQFLLAMLYGMKKPGRKRSYLDEYERYRPWHGGRYGGILRLEADGICYRVERNLRKEEEVVRIFRDDTGEELTSSFPLDSRKEVPFALHLLGIDREQFLHTLCIGPQSEGERMQFLWESARRGEGEGATAEGQGVRGALDALRRRLDALGSERAAAKPLGQAVKRADDAKRAYLDALERERSQRSARADADLAASELQDALRNEQVLGEELQRRLARFLNVQEAKRGERAGRLEMLNDLLREYEQWSSFDIDESAYREVQADFQRLLTAKREHDTYKARLETVLADSQEHSRFAASWKGIEDNGLQLVERTAQLLEGVERRIESREEAAGDPEEFERMAAEHRTKRRLMWLTGALGAITVPFALSQYWALLLVAAAFAYAAWSMWSAKGLSVQMEAWQQEKEEQEEIREADQAEQERLTALLLGLLRDFEVDTPGRYRQKWKQLLASRERAAAAEKQAAWLQGEMNRAKGERDIASRRLLRRLGGEELAAQGLDESGLAREIASWEERFATAQEHKEQVRVWERERDRLLHELERLEDESARWRETASRLGLSAAEPDLFTQPGMEEEEGKLEELLHAWQEAERITAVRRGSFAAADARRRTLHEGQLPPADALLQLEGAEAEAERLRTERDALALAEEVWADVQDEMYRQMAPRFTDALRDLSSRLTTGRYGRVHLDLQEAITLTAPESGHTVGIGHLSSGTSDQILFALGLAMAGWALPNGSQLPLLLDEPFRRYDDERLQEALKLLLEQSQERQIFLFTCREQEAEQLGRLGGAGVRTVELNSAKYGMIK